MINEYIKKIIFILLLSLLIYIIILVSPKLLIILKTIVGVILPFIIAFILAFIINPLVVKIEKKVKKRKIAIIIVIVGVLIIIGSFLLYTIPKVKTQFEEFKETIPLLVENIKNIVNQIGDYLNKLFGDKKIIEEMNLNEKLNGFFDSFLNLGSGIAKNILYFISSVFIIPVLTIYFLNDYEKIPVNIKNFLIRNNKEKFLNYLIDLSTNMRVYVKGVVIVMLILFILFSIAFTFLGIPYPLVFALFLGITNIIPYFGAYIGAVFPVLFALSDSYIKALITVLICVVVQAVEANIITPMIQKKYTKINPVYSILSLLVFGRLFGFIGMILAIPMVNVISITLKHYPIKIFNINK